MSDSLGLYFTRHTMAELYDLALSEKLLIAPVLSAAPLLAHPQLRSVTFFRPVPPYRAVPFSFARAHRLDAGDDAGGLIGPLPPVPGSGAAWSARSVPATTPGPPWAGIGSWSSAPASPRR